MKRNAAYSLLAGLVIAAIAYIWFTGNTLPRQVGVQFDRSGCPDMFASRDGYLHALLALIAIGPLLTIALAVVAASRVDRFVLPNADYWLTPERRAATVAFLQVHATLLGVVLVIFVAYEHSLIAHAAAIFPAPIPAPRRYVGWEGLGVATLFWVLRWTERWRVPSEQRR